MFSKVTFSQYLMSKCDEANLEKYLDEYEDIKIPQRATYGSVGYDFYAPFDIHLNPNETIVVPTGISWTHHNIETENGILATLLDTKIIPCLFLYPKSGLGFKYQLGMANTIPVIDFDYCMSDNGGHIMVKLVNNGEKPMNISKGKGFVQGVVQMCMVAEDEELTPKKTRNGGFGSTEDTVSPQ